MLSRRELLTAGVAGGLAAPIAATPADAAPAEVEQPQADREGQREIAKQIANIEGVLRNAHLTSSLSHGFVGKVREQMTIFLRGNQKFPDFIEIGNAVFMDLYDWHVKNRQQLMVTRQADGRYTMQFMFTTMIMRVEQDPAYVGTPYDKG
ncbi:MAG TPA: hypothetical protein VNJ02_19020 [Vicinamibacterales bacterium]|nr:hypothetical protein [Vicinamibacterales bacterium]